jgi:hypothetical protein
MPLTAKVQLRVEATQLGANALAAQKFTPVVAATLALANGTGVNQADLVYAAERSVASATNDDIDVYGVLADAFGATLNIAEIVAIAIVNVAADGVANTTALTIGAGTNPFAGIWGTAGDQIVIPPGGMFLIAAGGAAGLGPAAAGSTDILRVANASGAVAEYQIIIIGRSA